MASKFTSFVSYSFVFFFATFLAVHFAYMKSPSIYRGIASDKMSGYPWYDASFKL